MDKKSRRKGVGLYMVMKGRGLNGVLEDEEGCAKC